VRVWSESRRQHFLGSIIDHSAAHRTAANIILAGLRFLVVLRSRSQTAIFLLPAPPIDASISTNCISFPRAGRRINEAASRPVSRTALPWSRSLHRASALRSFASRSRRGFQRHATPLFRGHCALLPPRLPRPRDRLFFIIGADAFLDIPTWKEYETLLTLCDFIIANRPGIRTEALRLVIPPDSIARPITRKEAEPPCQVVAQLHKTVVYLLENVFQRTSPLPTCDAGQTVASPSMGLFPRASRNTFSTGPVPVKLETLPQGVRLAVEAAQEKKAGGHHCARPYGCRCLHRIFCGLHGFSTPQVQAICTEIEAQLLQEAQSFA